MIEEHYGDFSHLEILVNQAEISMQPDGCLFFESLPSNSFILSAPPLKIQCTLSLEILTKDTKDSFLPLLPIPINETPTPRKVIYIWFCVSVPRAVRH